MFYCISKINRYIYQGFPTRLNDIIGEIMNKITTLLELFIFCCQTVEKLQVKQGVSERIKIAFKTVTILLYSLTLNISI